MSAAALSIKPLGGAAMNHAMKIAYYKQHGWPKPQPWGVRFVWHAPELMLLGWILGHWIASLW